MPHFTRRLTTEQGTRNFYFNRIYSADGERFHVSVMDKDRKLQVFYMAEQWGRWTLVKDENTPAWIARMEQTLKTEILRHLKV